MVPARDRSRSLLEGAAKAQNIVDQALSPNLTQAQAKLEHAVKTMGSADDDNNAIQL